MNFARIPVAGVKDPAVAQILEQMQTNIQQALNQAGTVSLQVLYAAPARAWDGMVVVADGVTWNPGSGKGAYRYDGSSWNFLG